MNSTEAIALFGVVIPMLTISGSAVAYIVKYYSEAAQRRRKDFFLLMELIDGAGTMAQKVASVYQLRGFSEHKEFIVRFCEGQQKNVIGDGAQSLKDEMQSTLEFFKSTK